MFVTTREPGERRRSKIYSSNTKPLRSSKLSLLSALSAATAGSGGSNSTVTQESYDRSHHKTKRRRPREHHSRSHRSRQSEKNSSVDVFDFLVEEKEKQPSPVEDAIKMESDDSEESEDESEELVTPVMVNADDLDPEGFYRTLSDSGISMGSSTTGSALPRHLSVLPEEPPSRPSSRPKAGTELALMDSRWGLHSSSPQPYPEVYIPPPAPPPPSIMYDVPVYQSYPVYEPYGVPTPPVLEADEQGPSITIREPPTQPFRPRCFRSFVKVSTRLLLQHQDDIAELEEELKVLDEESDTEQDQHDHRSSTAGSERHMRKVREAEIYRELQFKLDQYYHALEMTQKVEDMSQPALKSDLQLHKQWLEDRVFPSSRTRHMVGRDLRTCNPQKKIPNHLCQAVLRPQYLAYTAVVNTLVPLVLYKLVTGSLNRLILLALTVVMGAIIQDRRGSTVKPEEMTCMMLCVGISIFAAVLL